MFWPYRIEHKKKKVDDLYTQIKEAMQKAEDEKKAAEQTELEQL
jgi:hypothetical protein